MKIYCEVHDFMRAAVIVVENPYHAIVDSAGHFTIPNIPAGRYRLVVWHMELKAQELDVTVPASGVVQVRTTLR